MIADLLFITAVAAKSDLAFTEKLTANKEK